MYSLIKKSIVWFVLGLALAVCGTWVFWNHISTWFKSITPQIGFVSDVVAYQAAIIAIAIPLSFQIISQISERYQSGVITRELKNQWQFQTLICLVVANSISAVFLKAFVEKLDEVWKYSLAWFVFLTFIATFIVLLVFFYNFLQYATDTKFLVDRLFTDLDEVLKRVSTDRKINDNKLKKEQEIFIRSLEGIGDILVFDIKKRKGSAYVDDSLWKIQDSAKSFLQIQYSYPERFEKLLYSHELLQLNKTNKIQASLTVFVDPKKHLIAFTAIINQFLRIREATIESKNNEMRLFATYNLTWLLEFLFQGEDRDELIGILLRVLRELSYYEQSLQEGFDEILYFIRYNKIIFKDEFKLKNLSLIDQYFIQSNHEIISSGKTQLFNRLVILLHEEIYDKTSAREILSNVLYDRIVMSKIYKEIHPKIKELSILENQLQTYDQLQGCLAVCNDIKNIIKEAVGNITDRNLKEHLQHKYDEVLKLTHKNLVSRFKFNHLVDLTFDLGAWCIFKNRFDYICYLWEYRQPKDADATWINSAIIPQSLTDLFNLYFRTHLGERIFSTYWENHHGRSQYYDQYFLILLLRGFLSQKEQLATSNLDRQDIIDSFHIPEGCDVRRLNNIQNLVDKHLIPSAKKLKSDSDSLSILNFDIHQLNDAIDHGIIPFLESLKEKSKQQIEEVSLHQRISDIKVEEFKSEFLKSYFELASVRNLFKFFGLYEDKLNISSIKAINPEYIRYREIEEKQIFFEKWYINYSHVITSFGQGMARKEDYNLLIKIIKSALKKETSLDEVISSYNGNYDNLIIININSIPEQLYNNRKFQIKSGLHETDAALELVNLSGFIGLYAYSQDHKIPIFNYYPPINPEPDIPKSALLVIDKNRLGKLVQYSPVEETTQYHQIKKHIAFNIQAFAENDTLMNEYLHYSPSIDWLTEKGDISQQENYLRSRVLIEIYERFSLELDPNFVGFLIPNNDRDNISYS